MTLYIPSAVAKPRKLHKVLIANRGEIAVRILRGLKERGIEAVAVYSDADREALHVRMADEAYRIGPAASSESYLRAEAILDLALQIGADGIHPGYGFLAENAGFARQVSEAGVTFIGPPPAAIEAMGSKIESRRIMREAGVPQVPGGVEALSSLEEAAQQAEEIGYPVMLKASAGGGGKGMRMVESAQDLKAAWRAARSEAKSSFGDDAVYLEKFLLRPRHVEIQVLGDQHGTVISLGERECSLQRRHQKVVEEAPSPVVDAALRPAMGTAAVKAAEAVGYTNAGTVEFLLDEDGSFYFLEMNTRLQVEHPITELVTGVDLVAWQLAVAEGERIPTEMGEELAARGPQGHAIEVRLYAEDASRGFAPSPGVIQRLRWPDGPGVRVDAGVAEGDEVTVHYDPMLAKLIVWASDRRSAIDRLGRALDEMRVEGIETTRGLFQALVANERFRSGEFDIGSLDRMLKEGLLDDAHPMTTRRTETYDATDAEETLAIALAAIAREADARKSMPRTQRVEVGSRPKWSAEGRSEGVGES